VGRTLSRGGAGNNAGVMAIVKANFVKRDKKQKQRAKATVKYMEHRPGKEGRKTQRALFGSDGVMDRIEAYNMIDDAGKGSIFFRFVVSPNVTEEDTRRDLDLRALTEETMSTLSAKFKPKQKVVQWVAAVHDDHTDKRHVHILAVVPGRVNEHDLTRMIATATTASAEQRRALDAYLEQQPRQMEQQQQKGGQWAGQAAS
jgi:hypothetical protein